MHEIRLALNCMYLNVYDECMKYEAIYEQIDFDIFPGMIWHNTLYTFT